MAEKFDLIYPAATNILGYEYGGGPGGNGGKDGDPKIQILIRDILDADGNVAAGGYFWPIDFYSQSLFYYSNLTEMFYIDTSQVIKYPDYAYSILTHELQHMINFNEKFLKRLVYPNTWYNEMLSMMTEDLITSIIGISYTSNFHLIQQRVPLFLETYNKVGVTEWGVSDNIGDSYAKGYAFGAYLLRNFGGAELLKNILANDSGNIQSVTAALNKFQSGLTFEKALSRYGETMIYSGDARPGGAYSFDKTVTKKIGNYSYTVYGFDVWNISRRSQDETGPLVFGLTPIAMRPYSLLVQSAENWRNISGDISVVLEKPNNTDIVFYLMVK